MKQLITLLLLPSILLFSCVTPEEDIPQGKHNFYITGYMDGFDVDFQSGSRVDNSTPDDVHQLHVQVLNANNEVVYEQFYYEYDDNYLEDSTYVGDMNDVGNMTENDWYYGNTEIPDTLFIPELPAGQYLIIAATTFIGGYYYVDYPVDGQANNVFPPDYESTPQIDAFAISNGPIYTAREDIVLEENEQEVILEMSNKSARISMVNATNNNNSDGFPGWIEMVIETQDNHYYSFIEDQLLPVEYDYDAPLYTYLDYQEEQNFYFLPKTLTSLKLNIYNYYTGTSFSQEVDLDPDLQMQVGDMVTFTIDIEEILNGAGTGTLNWEDINWNDLGEITIP